MIVKYEDGYRDGIIALWNSVMQKEDYRELARESFREIFTQNPYFDPAGALVLTGDDGGVQGFACGCVGDDLPLGDKSGYLTCIVLDPKAQTEENFNILLYRLEQFFIGEGKRQAEVLFFNPMLLPWYIPNTPKHEHNNAPGVPVNSWFHQSLLRNGYAERARECAMYLNLKQFAVTEHMRQKESVSAQDGYEVTLFDPSRHFGVSEMLTGFDNPLWQKEITEAAQNGIPVVVAAKENQVVGFAGPVVRSPSGRGYFSGIGVKYGHEGHGLGSVLFFKLCESFQAVGAEYMSLYTGLENPARNIYEHAGFIPVKEFAIMRKELVP